MAHEHTTDSPYTLQNKSSMTVFLGMKIITNTDGILTTVQPKEVGWKWTPQRFIEYGSCHTHYTKCYMLKGLLIRTLTICNSQADFMKAVIYYTQGLISRGYPANALCRAWRKFLHDKIPAQSTSLKVLSDQDNLQIHKWDEISPIQTSMLIVVSGKRWTAVLKDT